ncbi:Protein Ves [Pandoraea morbifera]|uniref:Protein Ves n=1 Tax=Pandoraea morbifera TaxID=2508300 RepID=A0A5E4SG83_9BURK|nr:HutD family protein [Pandoraea morbifera]VVD74133.1 Protein Ves [Pandoraea morbifera]
MTWCHCIALDAVSAQPWKNGTGVTRTLAVRATARGQWRVSLAEIACHGPYSCFDGVDRHSLIVGGRGIVLRHGDEIVELAPGVPAQYDGKPAWNASLVDGPCEALNVMVDRLAWRAHIEVLAPATTATFALPSGSTLLLFSGDAECEIRHADERCVTPARTLARHDVVGDISAVECTSWPRIVEDAMPSAVVVIDPVV